MKPDNLFENLPVDLEDEVFEAIVNTGELKIERIVSKGHVTPQGQWYDQALSEWVMLVKGQAKLEFEDGQEIELKSGDHITIPAHCKHRVSWTLADEESIWLAVHY